ncbi:MAG: PIN domain-containing protein [bacterium]
MRAILDTNVIISATLIRGGNEDRILHAWQRGAFELVLSPQILEEIGRALFSMRSCGSFAG